MNLSVLTQKIGPLPAWAWAGLAATGVWYFLLRGKTGAPTANAAASGSQLSSGYGLGYAQGLQAAGPQPVPTPGATSGQRMITLASGRSTTIWSYDQQHQGVIGQAQGGQLPVLGQAPGFAGGTPGYLVQWGQGIGWVSGADVVGTGGGIGGAKGGSRSIGSRSANLWHHSHPLIGARVPYQYHVRAVGGAPNHAREVHRVAQQAGVHPARLMALNPTPTGYIRVA